MKIEICEQMIQSWLLHCEQCQIVQTNWSISPLHSISQDDINTGYEFVKDIQDKLNDILENEYLVALQESVDNEDKENIKKATKKISKLNIIKRNKASQFMRQCEIDALGVRLNDGQVDRVYLMDSAFHKGGLGYHDVVATVIKKLLRAVIVSKVIFGNNIDVTVGFVSPECKPGPKNAIEKVVNLVRNLVSKNYPNVSIELYFNERFANTIFKPLVEKTNLLNNDNDLFMRALNLFELAEKKMTNVDSENSASAYKPMISNKSLNKVNHVPSILFKPSNIDDFKSQLMNSKRAEILWEYNDGTICQHIWKADNIKDESSIKGNIQSMSRWKKDKKQLKNVTVKVL